MLESEQLILKQFAVDLKRDVIPNEILPYLLCLTDDDCEQIQYKQDREGPRAAVPTLLDRLKKRPGEAFKQFLTALEQTGCQHLKILLENGLRDQTHHPEPEQNMTRETSNLQSKVLKTPTTETAEPFTNPSLPETKQPVKPNKKSKKRSKRKNHQIPRENTTSPTRSKTQTKIKADPLDSQSAHTKETINTPYVKLRGVPKDTANTPSKRSGVSQRPSKSPPATKTKEDHGKEISTTNPICTQSTAITDPTSNSEPTETDLIECSKTQYDTIICYAKENREIAVELKKFLETEYNLQVCIDFANFIPGKATTDNISESINSSGSVIFLLSPEFREKLWAPWELKHAVHDFNASLKDGKFKTIIPVLLKECQVPKDLKIYTAIKMEESGSRKHCWRKVAAAISGQTYSLYGGDDGDHGGDFEDVDEHAGGRSNEADGHDDEHADGVHQPDGGVEVNHDSVLVSHDGVEVNFDGAEVNFDGVEVNFDGAEVNFDGVEVNHDGIEVNHDGVEVNHDGIENDVGGDVPHDGGANDSDHEDSADHHVVSDYVDYNGNGGNSVINTEVDGNDRSGSYVIGGNSGNNSDKKSNNAYDDIDSL